jgi:hypothetical protein
MPKLIEVNANIMHNWIALHVRNPARRPCGTDVLASVRFASRLVHNDETPGMLPEILAEHALQKTASSATTFVVKLPTLVLPHWQLQPDSQTFQANAHAHEQPTDVLHPWCGDEELPL